MNIKKSPKLVRVGFRLSHNEMSEWECLLNRYGFTGSQMFRYLVKREYETVHKQKELLK